MNIKRMHWPATVSLVGALGAATLIWQPATAQNAGAGRAQPDKAPPAAASTMPAEELEALLQRAQSEPAAVSEADIRRLLVQGAAQGKPFTVSLALKAYLAHHFRTSPTVQWLAAQNALAAGDFRTAAARMKGYLTNGNGNGSGAEGAPPPGQVAAHLYAVLIDFLGDQDDAYQFMTQHGAKLRQAEGGQAARRFDRWYLQQALRRKELAVATAALSEVFADKLPLELEKLYFWDVLDTLTDELSRPGPAAADAAPAARKLAGLIRDDAARGKRLAFFAANAEFVANSARRDASVLEAEFRPVAAAAKAYFEASPSAATLGDVVEVFSGGRQRWDKTQGEAQAALKGAVFAEAFGKLKADEQARALQHLISARRGMIGIMLQPPQWAELALKHEAAFRSSSILREINFLGDNPSPQSVQALAKVLAGVPSRQAAAVNALAAGGDSFAKVLDHLAAQELWHLSPDEPYGLITQTLWPLWRSMNGGEPKQKEEVFNQAFRDFAAKVLVATPLALDIDAARTYLQLVVRGPDKAAVPAALQSLAWVPYLRQERGKVFNQAYEDFKSWVRSARDSATREKKAVPQETLALISAIEDAFKTVTTDRAADLPKAPNELTQAYVDTLLADRGRDGAGFLRAGKALYAQVKDAAARKTAFGLAMIHHLAARGRQFEAIDLQAEILADQLAGFDAANPSAQVLELVQAVLHARPDWPDKIRSTDKEAALKVARVFEQALLAQMDKGRFSTDLFDGLRRTRRGRDWSDPKVGEAVMSRIIETGALHRTDWRPDWRVRSATVAAMWLVRNEFPGLAAKYPVERWFDTQFIEEVQKTGVLDSGYWSFGLGEKNRVTDAVTQVLIRTAARLPLEVDSPNGRAEVERWQSTAQGADPKLRDALVKAAEGAFGKTRFDEFAMGRGYFTGQFNLKDDTVRAAYFSRLAEYLDRMVQAHDRLAPPYLGALAGLDDKALLSAAEVDTLTRLFAQLSPQRWPDRSGVERAATLLAQSLLAQKRYARISPLAGHLWKVVRDLREHELARVLARIGEDLASAGQHDTALILGMVGQDAIRSDLPEDVVASLSALRAKTLSNLTGIIPVKRSDPRYAVFAAQAAWLIGRTQSAWDGYLANAELVQTCYKELDPHFVIWLIERNAQTEKFEVAETLSRNMMVWLDSMAATTDPETRARLLLAYGNLYVQRGEHARARAQYDRIAVNSEFDGTRTQLDAQIKVADVDRMVGQYDRATEILEKLSRKQDAYLQTEAFYHLALVKFDREEYTESRDLLEKVFTRQPDHANARILEAQVNLKRKKVIEATDVVVGQTIREKLLTPGRPLRVTLEDQNLSVVGKATNVELRVWTDSGDEELFGLVPFGDSKTKFRGEIGTALGAAHKGDGTLQVLGQDTIHYDYSPRFKAEARIVGTVPSSLTVATNAELYVASGRILSRAEMEARALERMIRQRIGAAEKEAAPDVALSTVRREDQIKPGNKINVRVIDPDRSLTAGRDTVMVKVAASSGDTIAAFPLQETGEFTGVFEGAVPTASGLAVAYASDSDDGREPNMVISAGDMPGWVGLPDNGRPKTFSVDLNDNVALADMTVKAGVAGRKLKDFQVQVSLNGREFATVGAWPAAYQPWDGAPRLEIAKWQSAGRLVAAPNRLEDIKAYLESQHIRAGVKKTIEPAAGVHLRMGDNVAGLADKLGLGRDDTFVLHLTAAYSQDLRQVRRFELVNKNPTADADADTARARGRRTSGPLALLLVNGQPGTVSPTAFKGQMPKGVHRLDLYLVATRAQAANFELMIDDGKGGLVAAPAEMFDIAKHPEVKAEVYREAASVKAAADGGSFDIAFAAGTQARVVRLLIADFETDAPAIEKISLKDRAGQVVLPTKTDFLTLRQNQVLEVVPGDKVTLVYEDPVVLVGGKAHHEAFLQATYANATVAATFAEYTVGSDGKRTPRYVPLRRFKDGDAITVFVNDPDMDVTDRQDEIVLQVKTTLGQPVEIKALETAVHSGVFVSNIFPIRKKPSKPTEIQITEGDDLVLSYLDRENTDPGIPWLRLATAEQIVWGDPVVNLFQVTSRDLAAAAPAAGPSRRGGAGGRPAALEPVLDETVPATRIMDVIWPGLLPPATQPAGTQPATTQPEPVTDLLIDGPLLVEVVFPAIAQSPESTTTLYVQTRTGRKLHGQPLEGAFDLRVPGTLKLQVRPSGPQTGSTPVGYQAVNLVDNPAALAPLDDGRFCFNVPMELGPCPEQSLALGQGGDTREKPVLKIRGDDEIYIAYRYKDEAGQERWITRTAVLSTDAFFDLMDRKYAQAAGGLYVGEAVYLRVIDKQRDSSDEKDQLTVEVATTSGGKRTFTLMETFPHSGVFKGVAKMVYKDEHSAVDADPTLMPVAYGDQVTATYTRRNGRVALSKSLNIFKGSDGDILPFTKRFKDPHIAVLTQFTMAESYFELAKRHREIGQEEAARAEIALGKKLLEEAVRDYPDTEFRSQADYLLANLSLEFANEARDEETRRKFYAEAISRFSDIVASTPDGQYAPKAQYKKALTFEKMGLIDLACEEYVKLSYRYPDSELIADTIARLGQYFLAKGKDIMKAAEEEADAVKREEKRMAGLKFFRTSAEVFGRLKDRFPSHQLAGKTLVMSAQCYMQAEEYAKAVAVFNKVIADPSMEKELVAESRYWCGDTYMKMTEAKGKSYDSVGALGNAYKEFKKLTWDFPESKWARYARGRLADPRLANMDEPK